MNAIKVAETGDKSINLLISNYLCVTLGVELFILLNKPDGRIPFGSFKPVLLQYYTEEANQGDETKTETFWNHLIETAHKCSN